MAIQTSLRAPHREQEQRPLGGYAGLTGLFAALSIGFTAWLRRSGRRLPDRIAAEDLALITVATHKLARLIAKDRVTSVVRAPFTELQGDGGPGEVDEAARGRGLGRAIGELLVCPYCLDMWAAAGFSAGLAVAPRGTRWAASTLTVLSGADVLQIAYKKLEQIV
ncbi:MAG: DUF1360 domain-containing protein [Actinobacteria bacterium]|nr:MAG: DUF1360 domain-containing protein [Actinomycetota bacterium]